MQVGAGGVRMRRSFLFIIGVLISLGLPGTGGAALANKPSPHHQSAATADAQLATLRALIETPENRVDLAKAKVTIDRMIDPKIVAAATLRQLDGLAAGIGARFPAGATAQAKMELLVTSLSQPGAWNDHRPFSYDLNDPFGKDIHNKLLSTYLATRKGNCVSMPILLVILGQKLGLNMTLAAAPEHVLAKFRNDQGQWINIEATSFGTKRDASYQQELEISPNAIANRIYLAPLSRRGAVGVMLGTLMEFYGQEGQQERRIAVAALALQANPKDVSAMLQTGNAYFRTMRARYMEKYPSPAEIPLSQRADYQSLLQNNELWFSKAEALGWTLPSKAQNANYLQIIQRTKSGQQGGR